MLTYDQLNQFKENGYLVFKSLIGGDKLRKYMSIFDELVERARPLTEETDHWTLELDQRGKPISGRLHKVQGVCVVEPRLLETAREPDILDRVETLLGTNNIDVFGTKFFPKLAGGSVSTHWHQDNYYFGTKSSKIVSCAIYYEDTDRDNGCLRVIPASHRAGVIVDHKPETAVHGMWANVDESRAIDLILPAGAVVLFSANLLHGTYDNYSERTRYSTAWHYLPSDLALDQFPRGVYEDRHVARED